MNSHTNPARELDGIDEAELTEDLNLAEETDADAEDTEDYQPGHPRPDLDGEADEADVAEQSAELPVDEGEYER